MNIYYGNYEGERVGQVRKRGIERVFMNENTPYLELGMEGI